MADADDSIRFKAVNHVTYNVKDLQRGLRFWEDVLGVKEIPKQVNSDTLVWLQLPSGTMVHIIQNDDAPSYPSHHGAFEVDDIEATQRALQAKGPRDHGHLDPKRRPAGLLHQRPRRQPHRDLHQVRLPRPRLTASAPTVAAHR